MSTLTSTGNFYSLASINALHLLLRVHTRSYLSCDEASNWSRPLIMEDPDYLLTPQTETTVSILFSEPILFGAVQRCDARHAC